MLVNKKSVVPSVGDICTIVTRNGFEYIGILLSYDNGRYSIENPAVVVDKHSIKRMIHSTEVNVINLHIEDIILWAKASNQAIIDMYMLEFNKKRV